MARGWRSNSAEDEEPALGGAGAPGALSEAERREFAASGEQRRRRDELELMRNRILAERTSNPQRRVALAAALAEVEARLARLP